MTDSYGSKLLRATLILPEGNFPGTSSNTLTLVGFRMSATVQGAASYPNQMDLTIYGMQQVDMNAVTILWDLVNATAASARAFVTLEASSNGTAWTQVFEGTFIEAAPDYQAIPDASLRIQAQAGYGSQIQIATPASYTGQTSVAVIAQYLAGQMGFVLENNGVTGNLSSPYYPGTYMDQFKALCEHANLDFYFDGNTTLAICPKNQPRQGNVMPVISPQTGLIGYPSIQRYGIHVDALFTPSLILGRPIQIQGSDTVPSANGTWFPVKVAHELDSLLPEGRWFSHMDCMRSSGVS